MPSFLALSDPAFQASKDILIHSIPLGIWIGSRVEWSKIWVNVWLNTVLEVMKMTRGTRLAELIGNKLCYVGLCNTRPFALRVGKYGLG